MVSIARVWLCAFAKTACLLSYACSVSEAQEPPLVDPRDPVAQRNNAKGDPPNPNASGLGSDVEDALLGGISKRETLPEDRQTRAQSPAADAVTGSESRVRQTTDTGNLIGKSLSVRSVSSQQRTPIVTDTRIRGERVGQVLASGSYWAPARMDLDTMMNKIDSRLVGSAIIVKGPYSPRYGPGFSFVDIDMLSTSRSEGGLEVHGQSSVDYQTNGQQWYGRQTVYGGAERWGFRMSYGHRVGNDYTTGDGFNIPSSYQSGDVNIAFGYDITPNDRIEFNYLRLDQSDLEFPGLVYDLNYLDTNGYEIKYQGTQSPFADRVLSEVWYNRTRFAGDTFRPGKNAQIPQLASQQLEPSAPLAGDGAAITNGFGTSMGYRNELIFGDFGTHHWPLETISSCLKQGLNDIEIYRPANDNNFPIPPSRSIDTGFYLEHVFFRLYKARG